MGSDIRRWIIPIPVLQPDFCVGNINSLVSIEYGGSRRANQDPAIAEINIPSCIQAFHVRGTVIVCTCINWTQKHKFSVAEITADSNANLLLSQEKVVVHFRAFKRTAFPNF